MFSLTEIQAFLAQLYGGRTGVIPAMTVSPYAYNLSFTGLAQGTTQQQQLSIQANADFILTRINHRASIGAAQTVSSKTAPFIRALIVDSGTGDQFSSAAFDLENMSTNDGKMRELTYPRVIQGKSALSVSLTNWAPTAETYAVDLLFGGFQVRLYA